MKAAFVTLSALIMGSAIPVAALADIPKVIQGCEVKLAENGNYYNKVDATCAFTGGSENDTGAYRLDDHDGNPKTPDTFEYVDR